MSDHIEGLIAPIKEHLDLVERERAQLQYIKATIRVNAMRHGATEEEIVAMQTGEMSFVQWMCDVISLQPATDEQAMQNEKVKALVRALELALDLHDHELVDFKKYGLSSDNDIGERYRAALAALETPGNHG